MSDALWTRTIIGNPGAYRAGVAADHWEPADGDLIVEDLPHGGSIAQLTIETSGHSSGLYIDNAYYGPGSISASVELTPGDVDQLIAALTEIRANIKPELE